MTDDSSTSGGTDTNVYPVRPPGPSSTIPESVWNEIARLADGYRTPSTFLGQCMTAQPTLPDACGRKAAVVETLVAGDDEAVLLLLQWMATDADEGAPSDGDPDSMR